MSEPAAKQRPPIDLDEFERRLRGPAPVVTSQEDPLAELARLVGGSNRFRTPVGLPKATYQPVVVPPHDWRSEEPAAPAFDPGSLRGALPEQQDEYSADPASSYEEENFFAQNEIGEERPRRSHRASLLTGGALVLVLAGIAVTFAMKGHAPAGGDAPTIKAATGPTKVQPANHEAVDVADRNATLLDRTNADQVKSSKVVDRREQPVDLQTIQLQRSAAAAGSANGAPSQSATASVAPAGGNLFPQPVRVRTVSVRPDGSIISDSPPLPPTRPVVAANVAAPLTRSVPVSAPANGQGLMPAVAMPGSLTAATPKTTARVITTPRTAAAAADNAADAPPIPPANVPFPSRSASSAPVVQGKPIRLAAVEPGDTAKSAPVSATGAYAVQLAALPSEPDAKSQSARLEKKFSGELRGHHLTVVKADSNGRTVFRLRVLGLNGDDANVLCSRLKAGGGACNVVHD